MANFLPPYITNRLPSHISFDRYQIQTHPSLKRTSNTGFSSGEISTGAATETNPVLEILERREGTLLLTNPRELLAQPERCMTCSWPETAKVFFNCVEYILAIISARQRIQCFKNRTNRKNQLNWCGFAVRTGLMQSHPPDIWMRLPSSVDWVLGWDLPTLFHMIPQKLTLDGIWHLLKVRHLVPMCTYLYGIRSHIALVRTKFVIILNIVRL